LSKNFPEGVDVVIDIVGGEVFEGAIRCLRAEGRMVVVGFASGTIPEVKANYALIKGISVIGSPLVMGFRYHGAAMAQMMDGVYADLAAGRLDAFITERFSLKQFHEAAEKIVNRRSIGKIVLTPTASS
jgi:NADPH2:quinone reductase